MTDDADRAATALIAAFRTLADSLPGMYEKQAAPDVISLMSGLPLATLNGVFTDAARPDVTEIDRAAAGLAGLPLPWSIQFRGEPEPAAARVAARYELTARTTIPLMVYRPGADPQAPPARASAAAVGLGIFGDAIAGIFNIATVPAYRGRGYGRAVSSRIVADAVARGADLVYLQSSEDGFPLYQSMGFHTVETWTYLSTAPAA
jgi:N-acetylglutamate synthase